MNKVKELIKEKNLIQNGDIQEIEKQASELANFLQVSLEGL